MQPLVSICMPAYNAGLFLADAVQSIINQTYENWELIIVNDGSTDDTQNVLDRLEKDGRISLFTTTNGGASRARNIAFSHSKGNYIIFFDADDLLSPDFLRTQLAKALAIPDALILSGWGRFYNNDPATVSVVPVFHDELTFDEWISDYWYNCNPMTNPGRALIPRTLIEKGGVWNEQLSLNDDLEFFTRIMNKASKILLNHDAVLAYRSGVSGVSSNKKKASMMSLFKSIELSTEIALSRYDDKLFIKQSCANMWQSFIYIVYPHYNDLVRMAEAKIDQLAKPDLPYDGGRLAKLLSKIIGWKLTHRLKLLVS